MSGVRLQITLTENQAAFLDELSRVSRVSKSEIIRQSLDQCEPELQRALEAMREGFFRPATKAERKKKR